MNILSGVNMNKTKYDNKYTCKKCSGGNTIIIKDQINSDICECETICSKCGFEDFWAYGFFESNISDIPE